MRLFNHYRRFDDVPRDEYRQKLLEQHREKQSGGERSLLDLSGTAPPTLPNAEIVNAALAVARTRLHAYPDSEASSARRAIAARHGVTREQVVLGNGAAELLRTATGLLIGPGDEVIAPFPSYPLYPSLVSEARAELLSVPLADDGAVDPEAIVRALTERTRVVILCNPNDPTGGYLRSGALAELMRELPDRVHVLLDEALAAFQAAEEPDAALRLTQRFNNLICFRSFSKSFGLAGLRGGYAVGSRAETALIASLAPALGVNAVTQAAVAYAMEHAADELERRRTMVVRARKRLFAELAELPIEVAPSEATFAWLHVPGLAGSELARRLEEAGLRVASGDQLGDPGRIRVAVHDLRATERVTAALGALLAENGHQRQKETPLGREGGS